MTPGKANFTIYKGSAFRKSLRWEGSTLVYKSITAVTALSPITLTVPNHGIPNGWRFYIQSVKGMTQLNAKKSPAAESDFHKAVVNTTDSITIPNSNGLDYGTYTASGVIAYYTPQDLSFYNLSRFVVKDKVGGTELLRVSGGSNIVVDTVNNKIDLFLSAVDTAAITWTKGVYELELEDSVSGEVVKLLTGSIKIVQEIAT